MRWIGLKVERGLLEWRIDRAASYQVIFATEWEEQAAMASRAVQLLTKTIY